MKAKSWELPGWLVPVGLNWSRHYSAPGRCKQEPCASMANQSISAAPTKASKNSIGLVTEDRKETGLALHYSVGDNIVIDQPDESELPTDFIASRGPNPQ